LQARHPSGRLLGNAILVALSAIVRHEFPAEDVAPRAEAARAATP
jgi:hypothetical protein